MARPSLQVSLCQFLLFISEWLTEGRINEFNVEDVLSLFLPYYDTPHFAKMVTILHIK
jgi:U3 small nucleolar RNA-associated protein 10